MRTKIHPTGSTRCPAACSDSNSIPKPKLRLSSAPELRASRFGARSSHFLKPCGGGLVVVVLCCLFAATGVLQAQEGAKQQAQSNHEAALAIATKALNEGNHDKAIDWAGEVLRVWPDDAVAQDVMMRATLLKKFVKTGAAGNAKTTDVAETMSLSATTSSVGLGGDATLREAQEAMDAGNYDKAIQLADSVLQRRPDDAAAMDIKMRTILRKPMALSEPAVAADAAAGTHTTGESGATSVTGDLETGDLSGEDMYSTPLPSLEKIKVQNHVIAASADYFYGEGKVTLPVGYSLNKSLKGITSFTPSVADPDRSSDYYGATLSYSYQQAWYLDLSIAQGSSSGSTDIDTGGGVNLKTKFTIDDDWYQAYVRYTFPKLRRTKFTAYLRAGVSYVTADLKANDSASDIYRQKDSTTDILGNLGAGAGYRFYETRKLRLSLQLEAEGFYGQRTQDSREELPQVLGVDFQEATIDNDLYGGIGRATIRTEYRFGKSGLFKVFLDGGIQGRYTVIEYDDADDVPDETLWGPYIKLGASYAF